jgi:hypothetical protein
MQVTTQLSEHNCDWDCDSGIIAKTDLGLMETQSSSLNTGETSYDEASLSHKLLYSKRLSGASVSV